MHICFATIDSHSPAGGGGIASYVDTVGPALVARGHRVTVLCKGATRKETQHNGMKMICIPFGNIHWYFHRVRAPSWAVLPVRELEWSLGLRREVERLMRHDPIDVVEGCEAGLTLLAGRAPRWPPLVVRLHGGPYVFRKHSGLRLRAGERAAYGLELAALRRAAALTAPSRFHAREVARDLGWPPERITVIPNAVSPNLVRVAAELLPEHGPAEVPLVLYAGRLDPVKGILPLLQAVPLVTREFPAVQFAIAGGPSPLLDAAVLNELLARPGVRGHVRMLGHVPWAEMPRWYRRAALLVMPSLYETFGLSVVEAMAFELPVVATTAGALPEVVLPDITGLLVPPDSAEALAAAILRLLGDRPLRQRLGRAGRERVQSEYLVDGLAARMLNVYAAAAGKR